ncbi:uncharacterized protein AMSG_07011 [Thecamonas trahens ATCC 50062]|uniref:DH domain-containing protein n=1 Tax=Thecamonas trahens ATCC 50062 TaxID=461836 RepID=A0A0L0DI91_THETB|nr:hypothetical protein AMSG_07011 [Thecamonas trahens ATCC 50062]KNC51033.1 hypothetical protein AMSG_07011 [Thecamonas trahens ATCC 50062]|eukprot:XP_013756500.1 hypothetical protein AMSG_07011 [Thecamonas trahens ATCC 50062]
MDRPPAACPSSDLARSVALGPDADSASESSSEYCHDDDDQLVLYASSASASASASASGSVSGSVSGSDSVSGSIWDDDDDDGGLPPPVPDSAPPQSGRRPSELAAAAVAVAKAAAALASEGESGSGSDTPLAGEQPQSQLSFAAVVQLRLTVRKARRRLFGKSLKVAAEQVAASNKELSDFLESIDMGQYFALLLSAGSGTARLEHLTEDDLEAIGIADVTHREAILGAIAARRRDRTSCNASAAADETVAAGDDLDDQAGYLAAPTRPRSRAAALAAEECGAASGDGSGLGMRTHSFSSNAELGESSVVLESLRAEFRSAAEFEKYATKRKNIATEMLTTEEAYVAALDKMRSFLEPLQIPAVLRQAADSPFLRVAFVPGLAAAVAAPVLSRHAALMPGAPAEGAPAVPSIPIEDLKTLASNLAELIDIHVGIARSLRARIESWNVASCVGDVFLGKAELFRRYTQFVLGYDDALATFNRLVADDPVFASYAEAFRADANRGGLLPFSSFLLQPVQRIMRYPLLLASLVDHTRPSHPDYPALCSALVQTTEVAHFVDRQEKNWRRVKLLESHMVGLPGDHLAVSGRRLVVESWLRVETYIRYQRRYCLLFNDMLVVTKSRSGGERLVVQAVFPMADLAAVAVAFRAEAHANGVIPPPSLSLVSEIPMEDPESESEYAKFKLVDRRSGSEVTWVLAAKTQTIREEWLSNIRSVWRRHVREALASSSLIG